jgi:D-alanyl-D-alanine carboxypeptidase/D-alanyl-D-alanine-endopeptidase (penicillin-binding protein 4)
MKLKINFIFKIVLLFLISNKSFSQNIYEKAIGEIDELISKDFFNSSIIAIDVYDLTAEEIILKKNEKLLLHPASNQKIITTAAALLFLGMDYSFETSIYHTGEIIDSVCDGDIYIVGGCDPDFSLNDLVSLTSSLREFGIKKIKGNLYGDISFLDSLYWGKGWMWDDEPYSDFPHLTPLTVNDASVKFIVSPANIGEPVKIFLEPESEFYSFKNLAVTTLTDSSTFEIKRDWINANNIFTAVGELSFEEKTDTLFRNVSRPEMFFLTLLKENLSKHGIEFSGKLDTLTLPLEARHITTLDRKFSEVINNLNKKSDNLSAEMTLRALAYIYSGKPASADSGIILIDSLISMIGLDPSNYRVVDGSGVSHYNLVTTELISKLMQYLYIEENEAFKFLYESFPIAGVDGTLEKRMNSGNAYKNVRAKTGTLSGVSALSGYLTSKNGNVISFSIFIQNYVEKDKTARAFIDIICEILCSIE